MTTSQTHDTSVASRVRDFYRLVDLGDVPGLCTLFTDDCAYHRPGYPPILGRHAMSHFYTHERVIREASSPEDLATYLDAQTLVRCWGRLYLPVQARRLWEIRFPSLVAAA